MLSRAWAAIRSLLFPWDLASCHQSRASSHPEGPPLRKRPKHTTPSEPDTLPIPSPLETVNVDVFRLIADELYHQGGSLRNLSLSSRRLRHLSSSILFSRCRWQVLSGWDYTAPGFAYGPAAEPPEELRPFVRHLRVVGPFRYEQDVEQFHTLLGCFPSITSVTFAHAWGLIPWPVIRSCLVNPRVTSLSFPSPSKFDWLNSPPYSSDDTPASSLKQLSFTTTMWREHANRTSTTRGQIIPKDMNKVYGIERECFTAILLTMNTTATSLTLPIETVPLHEMSSISWPQLRHLCLRGRFLDGSQSTALQAFLPSLPSLETLSVQAARSKQLARPRLLARSSTLDAHRASSSTAPSNNPSASASSGSSAAIVVERPATPPAILTTLRSLTIAYPNPEDAIFSINAKLTHLSLCDCPRFYNFVAYGGERIGPQWGWIMPILNPAQCLSILRRAASPALTSLELVYMVPAAASGNDSDLLTYVSEAFPALSHLEIHRYRYHRTDQVDYVWIARMLAAAKSLRTVRLNLDFHDDHRAYCGNIEKRKRWRETFMGERGPEIVAIMEECPLLEHVALLYHGSPSATWVEFRTARCPGPRVVYEYDPEHVDSEPFWKKWLTI